MKSIDKTLPEDILTLQNRVLELQSKLHWYEEQFRLLKHKKFSTSSEKSDQLELFNEAEVIADEAPEISETITVTRKKPGRKPLPKDLPRKVVRHELPESEQLCGCGHHLHEIGTETSEQLEIIPAQVFIVEHVQVKYACRACEEGIKTTAKPVQPIPRSFASASLLAYIIASKFADSLPLYRQETIFKRYNIDLSRASMSNWVLKSAELLSPFYDRLRFHLLQQKIIQADETTLRVLQDGRANCPKSYMWLYQSGSYRPETPVVLYEYQPTRAGHHAQAFLTGFSGYLQADGYAGYHILESKFSKNDNDTEADKNKQEIILLGCMAHVRRKFTDALNALPKDSQKKPGMVQMALSQIRKLYAIETKIKDLSAEQRYTERQKISKPLLDKFKQWCDHSVTKTTKDSKLGIAIRYFINQWKYMTVYLEKGELQIDNNAAERQIKPFVIGRKNWMFNQTPRGAQASAILYSLVQTAKANNLEPFAFLNHLLTELPKLGRHYDEDKLDQFLPWEQELAEKIQPLNKVA